MYKIPLITSLLLCLFFPSHSYASGSPVPFGPCQTKSVAATSTSANVAFTGACLTTTEQVVVTNIGPNVAFWRCGSGTQTAVTTDMPIFNGTAIVATKGDAASNCAAITSGANTATIYFTAGTGS